jgi:hypothetical protein
MLRIHGPQILGISKEILLKLINHHSGVLVLLKLENAVKGL